LTRSRLFEARAHPPIRNGGREEEEEKKEKAKQPHEAGEVSLLINEPYPSAGSKQNEFRGAMKRPATMRAVESSSRLFMNPFFSSPFLSLFFSRSILLLLLLFSRVTTFQALPLLPRRF